MGKKMERYYIKDAALFFSRHPDTLRRWDSLGWLKPYRDERNHRYWVLDEMNSFKRKLKAVEGLKPNENLRAHRS